MRKLVLCAVFVILLAVPVHAMDFAPPEVPMSGEAWMPYEAETFSEGLLSLLRDAIRLLQPEFARAAGVCTRVLACVLMISVVQTFSGAAKGASELIGAVVAAVLLMHSANALIPLAVDTVGEISGYGKLLLPVMAAALGAQGMGASSVSLYAGTAVFDAVLSSMISNILSPMVYLYLALSVSCAAMGEETLKRLRDTVKGLMVWALKTMLYVFTGYMGITGVVTGTTDAAALKATKLTIAGVVPVVGGILSDASEAVLVGAGVMKNAAGVYGMLAVLAVCLEPFVRIGAHYLLMKLTAALCAAFGPKRLTDMVQDFSSALGLLLGMTGTCCLLLLISTVCFMKGAAL